MIKLAEIEEWEVDGVETKQEKLRKNQIYWEEIVKIARRLVPLPFQRDNSTSAWVPIER